MAFRHSAAAHAAKLNQLISLVEASEDSGPSPAAEEAIATCRDFQVLNHLALRSAFSAGVPKWDATETLVDQRLSQIT